MSSDRLRREIESLLRGYYRAPLGPSVARNPVLGAYGAARAQAREQGEPLPPDPITIYALCHGWLRLSVEGPWSVYTTAAQRAYLLGDGTEIPDSVPPVSQHWWGHAASAATIATCLDGEISSDYAFAWSDAPDLTSSSAYPWPRAVVPAVSVPPAPWTGEARGMAQALLMAGRDWQDILPDGWTADPQHVGIIWSPFGDLYIARVTNDTEDYGIWGVDIAKMVIPADLFGVVCFWLHHAATLGLDGVRIAKIWIYAYAQKPVGVTQSFSMRSNDYHVGSGSMHPRYRWQWYWQPNLDSPARAIFTSYKSASSYWSEPHGIQINWDEETGYATMTSHWQLSAVWGGPGYTWLRPTGEGREVQVQSPGIQIITSGDVHVYAWTTADGEAYVLTRASNDPAGDPATITAVWPPICGQDTKSSEGYKVTIGKRGGWGIFKLGWTDPATPLSLGGLTLIDIGNHWKYDQYTSRTTELREITSWSEYSHNWTHEDVLPTQDHIGVSINCHPLLCCSGGNVYAFNIRRNATDREVYASIGGYTSKYNVLEESAGTAECVAVLLPEDPGVALLAYRKFATVIEKAAERVENLRTGNAGMLMEWHGSVAGLQIGGVPRHYAGAGSSYRFEIDWCDANPANGGINYATPGAANVTPKDPFLEEFGVVFSSAGPVDGRWPSTLIVNDWAPLFDPVPGHVAQAPFTLASWAGSLIYSPSPTDVTMPTGLSPDVLTGTGIAAIGWA